MIRDDQGKAKNKSNKNLDKLFEFGIEHDSIYLSLLDKTENLINESFIKFRKRVSR